MSADPGGFFDATVHRAGDTCAPPWRSMAELGEPSAAWAARIAGTRAALAASVGLRPDEVEHRVAASVAHLGICARIIAPALARAAAGSSLIDPALERMWWQPRLGGPFPLSVQSAEAELGLPTDTARMLRHDLIDATMVRLARAVRSYSVSAAIAWGNVASALHSAAAMLAAASPQAAGDVHGLVSAMSADGPLAAAGRTDPITGFRRRSCCLIYRLSGERAAVCGDCILLDHQTSPSRQSQVISPSRSSGTAAGNT